MKTIGKSLILLALLAGLAACQSGAGSQPQEEQGTSGMSGSGGAGTTGGGATGTGRTGGGMY